MTKATVVLLTKNAEKYLDETLKAVFHQECSCEFEVMVIDSGSKDKTLEIISRYPIRLLTIAPDTFNHGDTRNLGAKEASPESEFIVYLSQDATPYNEHWLQNLINPFLENFSVCGVFSRHVPRPNASASVVRQLVVYIQSGGNYRLEKKLPATIEEYEANKFFYNFFSNTSSAIRRATWRQYPFERSDFAEDALWADTVIRKGLTIVFEPASTVIHSHDYSPLEQFRQNVDHSYAMNKLFQPAFYRNRRLWLRQFLSIPVLFLKDCKFVLVSPFFTNRTIWIKMYMMARSLPWQFATVSGAWVGANLDHMPQRLKLLLSRQERIRLKE